MQPVVVAIIDQGVDTGYFRLGACAIKEVVLQDEDYETGTNECISAGKMAHGTNIAAIIHYMAPHAMLLSIKIECAGNIKVRDLCKALDYCAEQPEINVINISLGILTGTPSEDLYNSCLACHKAGKILIAAAHQHPEKKCYPAAFPFVVGVGTGLITDNNHYTYLGPGYINVLSKGVHQRMLGENMQPIIRSGTSYAAATFTGISANIVAGRGKLSFDEYIQWLRTHSGNHLPAHYPGLLPGYTNDRTPEPCDIPAGNRWMVFATDDAEACRLADTDERVTLIMKYPVNPGNRLDGSLNRPVKSIDGFLSLKLLYHTDTLAVGNFFCNPYIINIYFAYSLIRLFIEQKKHLVAWDPYILALLRSMSGNSSSQYIHYLHRTGYSLFA